MKWVIVFLLVICLSSGVLALSGVSPGSYSVDYKEGLVKNFVFDFYIDGGEYARVFVDGDLAKYVTLDKDKLYDRAKLKVTLDFDEPLNFTGQKYIRITCADVVALIKVNFQKSNKYFYVNLKAPDAQAGDIIPITFDISSFNNKSLMLSSVLKIYSANNLEVPMNEFSFASENINSKTFEKYVGTRDYPYGNYLAVVEVKYEGKFYRYENPFYLGKLDMEVVNYTTSLREKKVGKFEIYVKNLWNSDIDKLYAQVNVVGTNYSFVTSEIDLDAMSVGRLEGFFDTSKVSGYRRNLNVIFYFGNKIKQDTLGFEIRKKFNFVLLSVVFGSLLVLIFIIFMIKRFKSKVNNVPGGGK